MRIFRHEIEVALKTLRVLVILALILAPVSWGYEQRRQSKIWQNVACAYRVEELTRRTTLVPQVEPAPDACTVLSRLGVTVNPETLAPPAAVVLKRVAARH
jgi:hypothetical protein